MYFQQSMDENSHSSVCVCVCMWKASFFVRMNSVVIIHMNKCAAVSYLNQNCLRDEPNMKYTLFKICFKCQKMTLI